MVPRQCPSSFPRWSMRAEAATPSSGRSKRRSSSDRANVRSSCGTTLRRATYDGRPGIVLCPPLGYEYMSSYRTYRVLARRLACPRIQRDPRGLRRHGQLQRTSRRRLGAWLHGSAAFGMHWQKPAGVRDRRQCSCRPSRRQHPGAAGGCGRWPCGRSRALASVPVGTRIRPRTQSAGASDRSERRTDWSGRSRTRRRWLRVHARHHRHIVGVDDRRCRDPTARLQRSC